MSRDFLDLLKVLAVTALICAAGALVMLYVVLVQDRIGPIVPGVNALPLPVLPDILGHMRGGGLFLTLIACYITATGLALLMWSRTIDTALLIAAKAATVTITALIGYSVGRMAYLYLHQGLSPPLSALTPAALTLAGFLVLSSLFSPYAVRSLGRRRLIVAVVFILGGPQVLAWL